MTTTTATRPVETAEKAETVLWLHGDHLSATNPALSAYPDAPVVFVFDETFLQSAQLAFHRLFFIYESVMDVFASRPSGTCHILRGTVVNEVVTFAKDRSATHIATTDTIGDRFAEYLNELEAAGFSVEALPVASLVPHEDGARTPKRFSAWWRDVETAAFKPAKRVGGRGAYSKNSRTRIAKCACPAESACPKTRTES